VDGGVAGVEQSKGNLHGYEMRKEYILPECSCWKSHPYRTQRLSGVTQLSWQESEYILQNNRCYKSHLKKK
jgi:hypothetical protein